MMNLALFLVFGLFTQLSSTTSLELVNLTDDCTDTACDDAMGGSCNQNARVDGDKVFDCTIVRRFNCSDKLPIESSFPDSLRPPEITSINKYMRTYRKKKVKDCFIQDRSQYPALNVSFNLPSGHASALKTEGIKLSIHSPSNHKNRDYGFKKGPYCRLFTFPGKHDINNPRILNYPCIVGLNNQEKKIYDITLTAIPMGISSKYHVTIFSTIIDECNSPTIAVAVDDRTNDVHVVLERTVDGPKEVLLVYDEIKYYNTNLGAEDFQVTFKGIERGLYEVQVSYGKDCTVTSAYFEVRNSNEKSEDMDIKMLVTTGSGILLAVLLIAVLVKYKLRKKPKIIERPPLKILLLYSYVSTVHRDVVIALKHYMEEVFKCEVSLDDFDDAEITIDGGVMDWLSRKIEKVDRIIVAASEKPCARCNKRQDIYENDARLITEDYIEKAVGIIVHQGLQSKCVNIYFNYCDKNTINKKLHSANSTFKLMNDGKKFYKKLHDLAPVRHGQSSTTRYDLERKIDIASHRTEIFKARCCCGNNQRGNNQQDGEWPFEKESIDCKRNHLDKYHIDSYSKTGSDCGKLQKERDQRSVSSQEIQKERNQRSVSSQGRRSDSSEKGFSSQRSSSMSEGVTDKLLSSCDANKIDSPVVTSDGSQYPSVTESKYPDGYFPPIHIKCPRDQRYPPIQNKVRIHGNSVEDDEYYSSSSSEHIHNYEPLELLNGWTSVISLPESQGMNLNEDALMERLWDINEDSIN